MAGAVSRPTAAMDGVTPLMSAPLMRSMMTVHPWCVEANVARRTSPVAAPPLLRVSHKLCCERSAAVVDHWFSEPKYRAGTVGTTPEPAVNENVGNVGLTLSVRSASSQNRSSSSSATSNGVELNTVPSVVELMMAVDATSCGELTGGDGGAAPDGTGSDAFWKVELLTQFAMNESHAASDESRKLVMPTEPGPELPFALLY